MAESGIDATEVPQRRPSPKEELASPISEVGYQHESKEYWQKIDKALETGDVNVVGVESLSTNGFTDSAKYFHKNNVISLELGKNSVLESFQNEKLKSGEIVVLDEGLLLAEKGEWSDEDIGALTKIIKEKGLKVVLHLRPELGNEVLEKLKTADLNIGETQVFGQRQEDIGDIIMQKAKELGLSDYNAQIVAEGISRNSVTVGEAINAFMDINNLMRKANAEEISNDIIMQALKSNGSEDCRKRVLVFVGDEMRSLIFKASEEKYGYETLSDREKALWQKGYDLGIIQRTWNNKEKKEIVSLKSPLLREIVMTENEKQNKLPQ